MKYFILSLFTVLIFSNSLQAQSLILDWVITDTLFSQGTCVEVDQHGNSLIAVNTLIDIPPDGVFSDFSIKKIDPNGNLIWKKLFGASGKSSEYCRDITIDKSNNIYLIGAFNLIDFDPGPGVQSYSGSHNDMFILKLDSNGNYIWHKTLTPSSNGGHGAIKIINDSIDGVYIGGKIVYTMDFDPGPDVFNLTANSYGQTYVLKLDTAGNFKWAKIEPFSSGNWTLPDIKVDHSNNVYIVSKTSSGKGYIEKLDAYGNLIWLDSSDYIFHSAIEIDKYNNIYTTGSFNSIRDFDPGPGITNISAIGTYDTFVRKIDSTGQLIHVVSFGGSTVQGQEIELIDAEDIFIAGQFSGINDFDPGVGSTTMNLSGISNIFVLRLDTNLNFVDAVGIYNNDGWDVMTDLATYQSDQVFITGNFRNTVDFNPNSGVYNLTANVGISHFLLKLNSYGVSIQEFESYKLNMGIFPNPTSNHLSIDTELEIIKIMIIDITGKTIKIIKQNANTINIADLSNGIYFITVITDEKTITKKFVKQ